MLRCRPSSPNHGCPLEYAFQSATTSCGHRLRAVLDRDVRRVVDGAGLTERDPDDALDALRQRGSHHAVDPLAIALRRLVVADVHDQHVAEPVPVPLDGLQRRRRGRALVGAALRRGGGTPRGRASTRTRASAAAGRRACRGSRRRPSRRRTSRGAVVTVRRSQRTSSAATTATHAATQSARTRSIRRPYRPRVTEP